MHRQSRIFIKHYYNKCNRLKCMLLLCSIAPKIRRNPSLFNVFCYPTKIQLSLINLRLHFHQNHFHKGFVCFSLCFGKCMYCVLSGLILIYNNITHSRLWFQVCFFTLSLLTWTCIYMQILCSFF